VRKNKYIFNASLPIQNILSIFALVGSKPVPDYTGLYPNIPKYT